MRRTTVDTYQSEEVIVYEIESEQLKAGIMNYGAALLNLEYNGTDVVLAHDKFRSYLDNGACLGVIIIPNANRTGGASYVINGLRYEMEVNDRGRNNLHSSLPNGAHKRFWKVEDWQKDSITLSLEMKDGDLGFPGNRLFKVTYRVEDNQLKIIYEGESDTDTVFNPTSHSYFNLNGHDSGSIMDHILQINAEYFTPYSDELICTGELRSVKNTPFDFRQPHTIGALWDPEDEQMHFGNGYDHNFVLNKENGNLCFVLQGEKSGIVMKCYTDLPGVQVYTGNYLNEPEGKNGAFYREHEGVALETQYFPNSLNLEEFETPVIRTGEHKILTTRYEFSVVERDGDCNE